MKLQDRALLVRLCIESWGPTRQDKVANAAVAKAKNSREEASRVSTRLAPEDPSRASNPRPRKAASMCAPSPSRGPMTARACSMPPNCSTCRTCSAASTIPPGGRESKNVVAKLPYYCDTWEPAHLGDLYKAELYPDARKMEAEFKRELDVLALNPGSQEVRTMLDNDYVDEPQRNAEHRLVEELYQRIAEPIQNMVRRLTDPEGEFRKTLVTNVEDMARLIPALNLTGDVRAQDGLLHPPTTFCPSAWKQNNPLLSRLDVGN